MRPTTLELQEGIFYIVIKARVDHANHLERKRVAQELIDGTVTLLAAHLTPQLFADLLYRGWLLEGDRQIMEAWVSLHPRVAPGDHLGPALERSIEVIQSNPDSRERFRLMSRFYTKSLTELPSEEKFLWLWTVLEIFPMKSTTDIAPISEYLSGYLGKPKEEVKDRLRIGRLYGYRCDLVHDGKFDMDFPSMVETIELMEDIVITVLNGFIGQAYDGTLERHFKE